MTAQNWTDLAQAQLNGSLIDPRHESYDRHRRVWNGVADRRPELIVQAHGVSDVAETVRVAAARGVLLAVRGGGHSLPGLSTCDGGILLDLSALNHIAVDPATRTVEVGGGALLGDLDRAGLPFGLATPAGVVSHTGVGGLTLGGGMGWLSRRFGLTIDSLLGADLVTADGRMVQTNAETEPDLFWGICGGGGNFGVVTTFRFRMHELGSVLIGHWTYALQDCVSVLRQYQHLAAAAPRQLTTAFTLTRSGLSMTAFWSGSAEGAEHAVSAFGALAVPETGLLGGQTFLDLQCRSDAHFAWGRRYYAKGGFLGTIDDTVIRCLVESTASSPTPDCELYVLQLGGAVSDVSEDATAYTGRKASYYWIVEPVWDHATDDARCFAWGRLVGRQMETLSQAGNYVNEQGDSGDEVAQAAYGPEKYDRLAKLKKRFDPDNVFRLNQNIKPEPN